MSDFRLMAETAADAVCARLGRMRPCLTRRVALDDSPVPAVPRDPPPSPRLKALLRAHPRLRELHAWSHLALGYLRHWARPAPQASARDFLRHYA